MDFVLTPEQRLLKQTVRRLAEREFQPRAARWDEEESFPWENVPLLRDAGLLGLALPGAYGGGGGSVFDLALVMEEIARCCAATAFIVGQQNGFGAKAIALHGSEALRARFLPPIARGDRLIAWAMSEPGAGSDLRSLACRARRDGDHWVVSGTKTFCSLGGVAHVMVVIARFDEIAGFPGLGALVVEQESPGFVRGRDIREMGLRGTAMADLFFDDCRVPLENLLIAPGEFKKILAIMDGERTAGNPPMSLGLAQGALDAALAYAAERRAFGQRVADFQGIRWMLAEMAMKVEAARLLVYRAAWRAAGGEPDPFEASVAKAFTNEAAVEVCNAALQIHGGYGYTRDFPVERMLRDARGLSIGDGTTEIQKNIIAKHLVR
ncbi:MAG: acyl-CoA dehydrogenase family protein [Candidatus Rokubacteria bacterium]|nr:acyl-CoA dehydrogenase family protein [Candidatus Rokubacteria bacterium]